MSMSIIRDVYYTRQYTLPHYYNNLSLQGLTEVGGPCSEGYYCKEGSTSATPDEESMGGECEQGFYCPQGL